MKYSSLPLLLLIACIACKATKPKPGNNTATSVAPVVHARREYKIDTVTASLRIEADKDYIMTLENVLVFVISKDQPAVAISVFDKKGGRKNYMLPQIQNMDTYSFGGSMHIAIPKDGYATIEIFNGATADPLPSKIVVMGHQE